MAEKSSLSIPLVVSAFLHVAVVAALAISVDFTQKPKALPKASSTPAIKAVVINQNEIDAQVAKIRKQKADAAQKERDRQAEVQRKLDNARKAREQEQNKIKKLEQQRKQKQNEADKAVASAKAAKLKQQQEKQKAAKAEKLRKQKEKEHRAAEKAAKAATEKRIREEAAAKKATDERKRKAAAEKKRKAEAARKAQQEKELSDALAQEQEALNKTRNKQVKNEIDKYISLINQTITRNITRQASMKGKTCTVSVSLAPDGFVIRSQVKSGNSEVCRATLAAIKKVQRLPVSSDPAVYAEFKQFNLIYTPESD